MTRTTIVVRWCAACGTQLPENPVSEWFCPPKPNLPDSAQCQQRWHRTRVADGTTWPPAAA